MAVGFVVRAARWRFKGQRRIYAYKWLAKALRKRLSLVEVLEQMAEHASDDGQRPGDPSAVAYREWAKWVGGEGGTLGLGMRNWVPPAHVTLIEAGERGESLSEALEACAFLEESRMRMRAAVVSAVLYPLGLGTLLLGLVYMCSTEVLPYFEALVPRDQWRGLAGFIPGVFDFVLGWGLWSFVALFVMVGVVVRWVLPRWVGRVRDRLGWLMVLREYRVFQGALFLVGFAELVSTRLKLPEALGILRANAEPWLASKIDGILRELRGGKDAGEAIWLADRNFPDVELNRQLRIVMSLDGYQEEMKLMAVDWVEKTVSRFRIFGLQMRMLFVGLNAALLGALVGAMGQLSRQVSSMSQVF